MCIPKSTAQSACRVFCDSSSHPFWYLNWFCGRQLFHEWLGGVVLGWFNNITFIVHFILIIASVQRQIIKHYILEAGDPCSITLGSRTNLQAEFYTTNRNLKFWDKRNYLIKNEFLFYSVPYNNLPAFMDHKIEYLWF